MNGKVVERALVAPVAVAAVVAFGADERARGAGADEGPFLYGSVLMANASSLLLPGANLTNLLVLASEPVSGATFVARVLPAALAAAVVTALGLLAWQGRRPRCAGRGAEAAVADAPRPRALGVVACAVAAVLVLVLLGAVARAWSGPAELLASASPLQTTAIGALAAVLVNNLPAAVLLSASPPPHPRALLFGLIGAPLAIVAMAAALLTGTR